MLVDIIDLCSLVCCDDKTDFGLEFQRPMAVEETLPWLSEHLLLLCVSKWLCCCYLFQQDGICQAERDEVVCFPAMPVVTAPF